MDFGPEVAAWQIHLCPNQPHYGLYPQCFLQTTHHFSSDQGYYSTVILVGIEPATLDISPRPYHYTTINWSVIPIPVSVVITII